MEQNAASRHLIDMQLFDNYGEIGDLLVNIRWGTYFVDLPWSFRTGAKLLGVSRHGCY